MAAFGAALLGGVAGGVFADASRGRRAVRPRRRASVGPTRLRTAYAELHERFRALYPALRPFGSAADTHA